MLIFRGLPGAADPYVKIDYFDFRTGQLLEVVNEWSRRNGKAVTVNAIDNGTHGNNGTAFTFHGLSLAWDFGVIGSRKIDFDSLADYLKMRLFLEYEVLVESDHIHVEWDTKRGR